jgi:hypothetical protein
MLVALALSGVVAMVAASGAQARVGTASALKQHSVAKTTTPDPTCVIHSLRRFREAGEFGTHSSVADVVTVECEPQFAESRVTISSDELNNRCGGTLKWTSARGITGGARLFVLGPSITATLDNDGEATVVALGGPSCAPGPSIVSAHLNVPPFATVHTTYRILAPGDTPPGVKARPSSLVEDSVNSSAATIVYAEFPSVFAERNITIRSNELNSRCAGGVTWIVPGRINQRGNTATATLDNNGNAWAIALAGPSCSPGTSSIEASLNVAPFTSYLGSFNILSPRVTNP